MIPMTLQRVIDASLAPDAAHLRASNFLLLIGLGLALAVASASRFYAVNWLGERVVTDLRKVVFRHISTFDIAYFDTHHSAELMSRLTGDLQQLRSMSGMTVSQALRNSLMLIGAFAMMLISSGKLAALVLVAIPVVILPLLAYGRVVRGMSKSALERSTDAVVYAAESLAAIRTMQGFTQEERTAAQFSDVEERAYTASARKLLARAGLTALAVGLIATAIVIVLWYGASLVVQGELTTGRLGQFMLYTLLAGAAFAELAEVLGELNLAAAAATRINELLAIRPAIRTPEQPEPLPSPPIGEIEFDTVTFAYPTRPAEPALRGASFKVRRGEMVALVGPSGAGKSTVFNLLLRFYDPQSGVVRVDGVAANRASLTELRRRAALVPQDVALFAGSALDNIRYGEPDATREQVIEAARQAQAHDFIMALPDGYDTRLGERGTVLSGGQRQRIAIARAVLRAAPILLLDEATSALDSESERDVQRALELVMHGRTTLVIAHRLATIQKADRILVLDGGRIVEEGTHAELIERGGRYARLAELQFEKPAIAAE